MDTVVSARTLLEQTEQSVVLQGVDDQQQRHQRNLDLALSHALIIKRQKEIQAELLEHIEELSEIPQNRGYPTHDEREAIKSRLSIFQPSDFDDLVAERVSQLRCGYVLCGQKPRATTMRSWKLTASLSHYCSDACARKNASIKVQLSEIPAWERSQQVVIVLEEPPRHSAAARNANADLAFERGEKATSRRSELVINSEIVEKITIQPSKPPSLSTANAVEGYVPKREQVEAPDLEIEQLPANDVLLKDLDNDDDEEEEQQWQDMFKHLRASGNPS